MLGRLIFCSGVAVRTCCNASVGNYCSATIGDSCSATVGNYRCAAEEDCSAAVETVEVLPRVCFAAALGLF